MKFLNFSFAVLSKFKRNYVIFSSGKNALFRHKNNVLHTAFISLFYSPCRAFSLSSLYKTNSISPNSGKRFQEKENEYAHHIMENSPAYSGSLLRYPLQNDNCTDKAETLSGHLNVADIFAQVTLHNLLEGLTLEDIKFRDIVEKVCLYLPEASDENIKKILHYLCMWPPTSATDTPNFKALWNSLDQECVKRMERWDVSHKLLIGDYWFHLKLSRITRYNCSLIKGLMKNVDSLSNHQLVQLMFFINLQREIPDYFIPSLEEKIESVINCLTLEEVGVVCLGFFKTQNKVSNDNLIQCIIKSFMDNVKNVNTVTVAAILKFLRKTRKHSLIDLYILALHKCVPCIDNFDIPTSVHLALLSAECNVYHPLLLNCISDKLANEMDNSRIKDCAKLLSCLSLNNHFEGKFHDVFIAELKKESRENEIIARPDHIVHSVLYYSYLGHYDYDLLAKIFEKRFVEETIFYFPKSSPNFAEIDYCVEIECPDYIGPKLDAHRRKVLQTRRGNLLTKSQEQNMQTRLLSDVYDSLVEILGKENVLVRHILPHVFSPDIIVRLSTNKKKSLADLCQGVSTDSVLKPPKDEVWAAFVVGGTFSFAYKSSHIAGIPAMKVRQLKKVGYSVTLIPYFNVSRNTSRRKDFLKEMLNTLEKESANSNLNK